jgi:hypothetical protein
VSERAPVTLIDDEEPAQFIKTVIALDADADAAPST